MNKIIIAVGITALLVITGIVVYQFAEQQSEKQQIEAKLKSQEYSEKYSECLDNEKDVNASTIDWCAKYAKEQVHG